MTWQNELDELRKREQKEMEARMQYEAALKAKQNLILERQEKAAKKRERETRTREPKKARIPKASSGARGPQKGCVSHPVNKSCTSPHPWIHTACTTPQTTM